MTTKTTLSLIIFLVLQLQAKAQVDKNSSLYQVILSKDSLLFNIGFNTCDVKQFEDLLSDDFEFFHDKDGTADKNKFLTDIRNGLCKSPEKYQARRELLPGSSFVYPLYKKGELYGAIQVGVHQFFEKQPNKPETFGSSAKFTHVWMLENGTWKLTRSLSYAHEQKQLSPDHHSRFDNDAALAQWLETNRIPTLGLGIIENGRLQTVKVFGKLANGISAPYNTIFNVASLTKPVTAMVVLKLVSLGKWNLDEQLDQYWVDPDVMNDPRHKKITTRLILSHQTGFPNWRWMNANRKLNFQFEPGTKYQYSGEGFEYLRKALENKFHKTLQQLADELLFKPLGMLDTRYIWDTKVDTTRLALGYDQNGNSYQTVKHKTANAADDLLTTIEDYGKFLVSVMNAEGLSKLVSDNMKTKQIATKNGKYFGLGFEIYDFGNGDIALSHGGSDQGVQTIGFIFPKTKQGLLIFTNVDDGYKVYEQLLTHYLGNYGKKIVEIETK